MDSRKRSRRQTPGPTQRLAASATRPPEEQPARAGRPVILVLLLVLAVVLVGVWMVLREVL